MIRELLKACGRDPDQPLPSFVPRAQYLESLDCLTYIEKDCSHVTLEIPHSNIVLLLDPLDPTKVVGVRIKNFSQTVAP